MNDYVSGTCELMCAPREVQMRTREKLLHFFESNPPASPLSRQQQCVCISEFSRSAAGNRTPRPADLRTPPALRRTIEYLIDRVLLDTRKPFWFVYEFVFDRMRSVRQECVIQNLGHVELIALLEPIVMFLAYSGYRLCESPIENFDPYVCRQHLQECLKKLLCCYDAVDESGSDDDGGKSLRNRHLFESLYLLFNMGRPEAISRGLMLAASLRESHGGVVQMCLNMSRCFYGRNFFRVLVDMQRLPAVLAGVAVLKLQILRREIFATFASAYNSQMLTVPLPWMQSVLLYSSSKLLVADLRHYKVQVNEQRGCVQFLRSAFDSHVDVIHSRQESFVNRLFADDSDLVETLLLNA